MVLRHSARLDSIRSNHADQAAVRTLFFGLLILTTVVCLLCPSAAGAFSISGFQASPSTKVAGAHPNLTVAFQRSGDSSEDIRDFTLDLPIGQQLNPEAATLRCTSVQFASDLCPASSQIGTFSLTVGVEVLFTSFPVTANGSIFVLEPESTDHATLGYVVRPSGFAKSFFKQSLTVGERAQSTTGSAAPVGTRLRALRVPRVWGSTNVTITRASFLLNARGGADKSGPYATLNPSNCTPASASLTVTSYQGANQTRTYSWTPSNCSSVPFGPSAAIGLDDQRAGASTGAAFSLAVPDSSGTIEQSAARQVDYLLPKMSSLSRVRLDSLSGICTSSELAADACPDESRVGDATASIPYFPPDFSGDIYLTSAGQNEFRGAIVLRGPRGMRFSVPFAASEVGTGQDVRVRVELLLPHMRVRAVKAHFSDQLFVNPECPGAPQKADVTAASYSGRIVQLSVPYESAPCVDPPPAPVIESPLDGALLADASPQVSGTAQPGSTVALFDDGSPAGSVVADQSGRWTVELQPSLAEGANVITATASNVAGPGPVSSPVAVTVDSIAPDAPVIEYPSDGGYLDITDVPGQVYGTAEPLSSVRLEIDGLTRWIGAADAAGRWHAEVFASDGPATLTAFASDAAGNESLPSLPVRVTVRHIPWPGSVEITSGPRNGLIVEDTTPSFGFSTVPASDQPTECSVDSGAWWPCSSRVTLPPLADGGHIFEVRIIGTTVSDVAQFIVGSFAPSGSLSVSTTQAASSPDLELFVTNTAADVRAMTFDLPAGMWVGATSAPLCDVPSGAAEDCAAVAPGSELGEADLTVVDEANHPYSATARLYAMVGAGGGVHVGAAFVVAGTGTYDVNLSLEPRYDGGQGYMPLDVSDPKGSRLQAATIEAATRQGTALHLRSLRLKFTSGSPSGASTVVNPSSCDASNGSFHFVSGRGDEVAEDHLFQATGCASVAFDPDVSLSFSSMTRYADTTPALSVSLDPGESAIRSMKIDLPRSIAAQFAGLTEYCPPEEFNRPGRPVCDESATVVGSASATSPLLPQSTPVAGELYMEESGGPLPYLHFRIHDDALGLDMRWRANFEASGSPSQLHLSFNTDQSGSPADMAQIPLTSIEFRLPGSQRDGAIFKVAGSCAKNDTTGNVTLESWSGRIVSRPQAFGFDPACPN